MRIVFVEIRNFRGIKKLDWAPAPLVNCLIGPGDSTKTTILDAIELALNPKSYVFADDSDFFDLDVLNPISITVTLAGLPSEFKADSHYGMFLRGWNSQNIIIEDEPGEGLEEALSIRAMIDQSLEARWSIFNDRISGEESDPPTVRYKDAKQFSTTRLGPYADRHLGWGRQSVLTRIGETSDSVNLQLAKANRAAREAFRQCNQELFKEIVSRAENLGKHFAVPVREKYSAELDVQGVSITAGGISLHDGKLPLRRLGSGSSRLIVSALQHDAGGSHIAIIDEIEHGLEPHRIARLLKYLKSKTSGEEKSSASQIFMTTHSPVVIRELSVAEISTVRSKAGVTVVSSIEAVAKDIETAQKHLRSSPEAFLARRILIGEGRTEEGLLRGFDSWWTTNGYDSFALKGAIAIDGGGNSKAPVIAEHLLDLGYEVLLLLDTDKNAPEDLIDNVKKKGGTVFEWSNKCSTEERLFIDVPWDVVNSLVSLAAEYFGSESIKDCINNACRIDGQSEISSIELSAMHDNEAFRRLVGEVANNKKWFKDITRGERLAEIIAPCIDKIKDTPLATTIASVRQWTNA